MKKQTIIILSAVLILLIAVAAFGYNYLSKQYSDDETVTTVTADTTAAETQVTVAQTETTTEEVIISENATTDFTMTDKNGNTVKLSDYFGKPIVVNFWASWCYPCTSEMPHFEEAYKKYGDDIHFIMVNAGDSYEDAYKFASKNNYTFPVYHDSTLSGTYAYGVSSIPRTLFISSNGELVHSQIGMMSEAAILNNIEKIK